MADINIALQKKSKNTAVARLPIRVDMTPMVDLGFLLITFFIFTAVISKPVVMQLLVPVSGPPIDVPESKTLTLLLDKNRTVCYEGLARDNPAVNILSGSDHDAVRTMIAAKQQSLKQLYGQSAHLMVIIKPGFESEYGQLVMALDEMTISDVKKYGIAPVDKDDEKLLSAAH